MSKAELSKKEQALLEAVEAGEFESVLTESRRKELQGIADRTFPITEKQHKGILSARKSKIENGEARFISLGKLKEYYKQ